MTRKKLKIDLLIDQYNIPKCILDIIGLNTIIFKENLTVIDAITKKPSFKLY